MDVKDIARQGVHGNDMAEHRDRWLVFFSIVINIRFHKLHGLSLETEELLAFH
jgi:hypothetical protein